jgi:hypothetical protein
VVVEKPPPVQLEEIENVKYARQLSRAGKSGLHMLLRLWCFTFTAYHRVVHLDMDTVVLQSLEHLYEHDAVEIMYTGDYALKSRSPVVPLQGGFIVFKPSLERFTELQGVIRQGRHGRLGWEESMVGNFWGGQSIAGLIPYVYHRLHKGKNRELDRCKYNCVADTPYKAGTNKCHDGERKCPDCRTKSISEVKSAHFRVCGMPWACTQHTNTHNMRICTEMDASWFKMRDDFEIEMGVDTSYRKSKAALNEDLARNASKAAAAVYLDYTMGMCTGFGEVNYLPIPLIKVEGHLLD